eukprot:g78684.t1
MWFLGLDLLMHFNFISLHSVSLVLDAQPVHAWCQFSAFWAVFGAVFIWLAFMLMAYLLEKHVVLGQHVQKRQIIWYTSAMALFSFCVALCLQLTDSLG